MGSFNSKSIFQFTSKSDIIKIIVVTSLFYVILHFIRITFLISGESEVFFNEHIWSKMTLRSTLSQNAWQPWSFITYIFTDMSFMKILGNMIWLWIFGTVLEDLRGSYRIIPIYLAGGILGGLLMVSFNTIKGDIGFDAFAGGLAALTAVATAAVMFKPTYKFWAFLGIGIPIWVMALLFLALNLAVIGSYSLGLLLLILGGIIIGVGYNTFLSSFFEWCTLKLKQWSDYFWNNDNFKVKQKQKTSKEIPFRVVNASDKKIDEILDKINEKGIDSLTSDEKRILKNYNE